MPSARDKCFKESVENLKDAGKLKKLNVQDQRRWVRVNGEWSQTSEPWYKVVGLISRVRKLIKLGKEDEIPDGAPDGTRIPDMTVTPEGGKPIVIDNKFDGDEWREGQKEDYNQINKEQNGNPKATNLQLNSQVCKCDEEGSTDPVEVPVRSPFGIPGFNPVAPSLSPFGAGVPEGVPAGIPLGEPFPVF